MANWGLRYLGFVTLLPVVHVLMFTGLTCTRSGSPPAAAPTPKATTSAPTSQAAQPTTVPATTEASAPTTFQEAVDQARAANKRIYLKFTATWCGPCKIFEREVLSTAEGKEALKKVVYLPVDIDEHSDIAERFNITGVPTGVLVKPEASGPTVKVIDRHVGMLTISELEEFLSQKS